MILACAMCGGAIEATGAVALAAASLIGAELYNRARLVIHQRRAAAELASLPREATAAVVVTMPRDTRELAAELAAS